MSSSTTPTANPAIIIIICGPTASGKTAFAVNLARYLRSFIGQSSEIINADSVQMYRDLKILTAYPSNEELSQIPHNLYGILSPYDSSSIASWLELANKAILRVHSADKIAIICGGTGFYINALLNGVANIPEIPNEIRVNTKKYFDEIGRDAFFEKLAELDPESAKKLHKNDTQRILRAYEVISYTSKSLSKWWEESSSNQSTNSSLIYTIVLLPDREKNRQRAHQRIQKMVSSGAIDEVRVFLRQYPNYCGPLKEVIGFCEIRDFIEQKTCANDLNELIEKIRIRTNQYIKRQSTWFRNKLKNATFISEFGDSESLAEKVITEFWHLDKNFRN